jgi:hypothetical protein
MATFAVMAGAVVRNVIVTDDKEQAEKDLNCVLIEYTPEKPAGIGWTWDGENFIPPVVEEDPAL